MTNRGPFHISCAPPPSAEEGWEPELQFGGKLIVSPEHVGIAYSFPGPDRRYRQLSFFIPHADLLKTSEAISSNWSEYERMKTMTGCNSTIEKHGAMRMTIRISLLEPGVWLFKRLVGVCNAEQAIRLEGEYKAAFRRLQNLL
jgi:hypothetical protein